MRVEFHFQSISYIFTNKNRIKKWICLCIQSYKKIPAHINIIFCDDEYLLQINKKYLNHNSLTDIITFDYSSGFLISGDIFISIDRVKENSKKFLIPIQDEMYRVIIHGILHLLGFKDKTPKEKKLIRKLENNQLEILSKM